MAVKVYLLLSSGSLPTMQVQVKVYDPII